MNRWDAQEARSLVKKYQVQAMVGVGFMIRAIMQISTPDDVKSLKMVSHGGAAAAKELPSEADQLKTGLLAGVGESFIRSYC